MESIICASDLSRGYKSQSPDTAHQPIWTSARCNRLLRPLSSKLALLRKAQALDAKRESEGNKDTKSSNDGHSAFSIDGLNVAEVISQTSAKPNINISGWTPSPRPRKRIKRTYSSREVAHVPYEISAEPRKSTSTAQTSKSLPGSFFRLSKYNSKLNQQCPLYEEQKILEQPASRVQPLGKNGTLGSEIRVGVSFRQFAKSKYPDRWQLIEGIQNGLETLLKVTTQAKRIDRLGARSLFSTCLNSVPQYIALEDAWCKIEDPESKADISSAVYNELEAYGSTLDGGWKPLKEVVRAHGISMLGSAVKDGLFEFPIAQNLVIICLDRGAFDEAQHIVECMIVRNTSNSASPCLRVSLTNVLLVLNHFACCSGRFGFQFRQLANMFRSGNLPIEWLLSDDMVGCWSRVMGSVTNRDSDSRHAGFLLQSVALISSDISDASLISKIHSMRLQLQAENKSVHMKPYQGKHADEFFNTYPYPTTLGAENKEFEIQPTNLDLLAAIFSIDLLQSSSATIEFPKHGSGILQLMASQVCQILEVDRPYMKSGRHKSHMDRFCLLLLAAGVSSASAGDNNMGLSYYVNFIKDVDLGQEFSDIAASFLCTVADCCGRATSDDGFQYIQNIIQVLVDLYTSCDCELAMRVFVGNIAASAAIQYSRSTSLPKHLSWALEIESLFNRLRVGMDGQTPCKKPGTSFVKTKLGYRWEEGICEWVAGTPIVSIPKFAVNKDQDITSPSLGLDDNLSSAPTLISSPAKAPTYLAQIPANSPRINNQAVLADNEPKIFEKTAYGWFLHVEIDSLNRINTQSPSEMAKRKFAFLDHTPSAHLSCAGSKIEKFHGPELVQNLPEDRHSNSKASLSGVESMQSIWQKPKTGLTELILTCDSINSNTTRKPSPVLVEPPMEQEESADELSFS